MMMIKRSVILVLRYLIAYVTLMQIVVSVKRIRREFGASFSFSDRNADKIKDGVIDCPAYDEKSFDLKRMELDRGTQVV